MIKIHELQPCDWDWIQEREPINWTSDTCGVVFIDDETNRIAAAFILYDLSINSAYCHVIVENPMAMRRKHLEAAFDYAFNLNKVKMLLGHVPSDNTKALRIDKHLGFVEHSTVENALADGIHEIKVILKKEDCKYLRK